MQNINVITFELQMINTEKPFSPTIPTAIPQNKLTKPTVRPAPNMAYPEK